MSRQINNKTKSKKSRRLKNRSSITKNQNQQSYNSLWHQSPANTTPFADTECTESPTKSINENSYNPSLSQRRLSNNNYGYNQSIQPMHPINEDTINTTNQQQTFNNFQYDQLDREEFEERQFYNQNKHQNSQQFIVDEYLLEIDHLKQTLKQSERIKEELQMELNGKNNAMKQENGALKQEMNEMKMKSEKEKQNQRKTIINLENELNHKNEALKQQISEMKEQLQKENQSLKKIISDEKESYRFTPVITQKHNVCSQSQPLLQPNSDVKLYHKHRNILKEWNKNSAKLKTISSNNNINESDDDEKKNDCSGVTLFNKYSQTYAIITKQSDRLTVTTTNDYLLELINQQNSLSKAVKTNELKSVTETQESENTHKQYEILKQQRSELQNKIELEFRQCNQMIEKENELFQQLQQQKNNMDRICTESKHLKSSSKECVSVIKLYNNFMENNKQYIEKINADFEKEWDEFDSKWMQWRFRDVIIWFKYKTMKMNTDKIDWVMTEKQLEERNVTGKSLQQFNGLLFEFIGIHDFDIVSHLLSEIEILTKKYHMNKSDIKKKDQKNTRAPSEYLCPITKQIMRDPVIAFDGHCYDRNAIESYLKINKKSPKTGANADYLIVFPNHKLKADIQRYIKSNNIDLEQSNEGIKDTAYV